MKTLEQSKAVMLRKSGISMGEIASTLGVAKSSVSLWVRDIQLTAGQRSKLNKNGHSVAAIEKRRGARLLHTREQRQEWNRLAMLEAPLLSKNTLWCIGVALYWGEGGKTQQTARLSNSDPAVIKTIMRFFRECCGVPEEKFRAQLHAFEHTNVDEVKQYWSAISGIAPGNFFKTYIKKSSASKDKRHNLPNGTLQIYVNDTRLFFRIMGWMEYIKKQYD